MNKVTQNDGKNDLIFNQIPQILYSTIISAIINSILKYLSLSEKIIISIKQEANIRIATQKGNKMKTCMRLKGIIFFILSILINGFFWYFTACFCAVYKNTQKVFITDTLLSFLLSMVYPFGLNLLPGFFRIPALKSGKSKCKFVFSYFISLF